MTRKLSIATALLAATAISTPLLAQAQSLPQDAVNLSNTKLSLPEAVAIAERHHAGSRSTQAELEFKKGQLYYEVEVVTKDNKVMDLKIDAVSGKVLESKPDNND